MSAIKDLHCRKSIRRFTISTPCWKGKPIRIETFSIPTIAVSLCVVINNNNNKKTTLPYRLFHHQPLSHCIQDLFSHTKTIVVSRFLSHESTHRMHMTVQHNVNLCCIEKCLVRIAHVEASSLMHRVAAVPGRVPHRHEPRSSRTIHAREIILQPEVLLCKVRILGTLRIECDHMYGTIVERIVEVTKDTISFNAELTKGREKKKKIFFSRTWHPKSMLKCLKVIKQLVITDRKHHRNMVRKRLHHVAPGVPDRRVEIGVADVTREQKHRKVHRSVKLQHGVNVCRGVPGGSLISRHENI